ncbi:MAG: rhodanese-like domain-containing protein, partial [Sediminibacterium sp.]
MALSLEQFQQILTQQNAFIIDTRDESAFIDGFIPSSIHFKPEIIHQAAALGLLSFEDPLLFIGENDNEKIAISYFEKLGFANIKGSLEGGFNAWRDADKRYDLIIEVEVDELAMDIPFDEYLMILDIRTEEEYNQGHIKNSIHLPLLEFSDPGSMSELDEHFNIYILSQEGETNTLAASILKK